MSKKPMHPDVARVPGLKKLIDANERGRLRGYKDKSKPLHRFHDEDVSDEPVETRNAKWASDYITDHSYMGGSPLHHETVHPSGKSEWQTHQPGEWVAPKGTGKFAFKN